MPSPTAVDDPPDTESVAAMTPIVAKMLAELVACTSTSPPAVTLACSIRAATPPLIRFTATAPPPDTEGAEELPNDAASATEDDRPSASIVAVRAAMTCTSCAAESVFTPTICAVAFDRISLRAKVAAIETESVDLVPAETATELDLICATMSELSVAETLTEPAVLLIPVEVTAPSVISASASLATRFKAITGAIDTPLLLSLRLIEVATAELVIVASTDASETASTLISLAAVTAESTMRAAACALSVPVNVVPIKVSTVL